MNFKKILYITGLASVLGLVIYSSYSIGKNSTTSNNAKTITSQKDAEKFDLLAKRIFIDDPNDPQVNFSPLRQQIKDYYANNGLAGSIYFEYLPTGTSIRVDGDTQQVGASLLKLPFAMELYKAAELGKLKLSDRVTLNNQMLDDAYGELYKKGAGYSLSLNDAVKIMLENSDNTALNAIAQSVANKVDEEQRPHKYLDIDLTQNDNSTISVSARSYSSLLKCLYFACYNNKEDSQEILQFLTKSVFMDRLAAGIPNKDIKVAHKIGSYSQDTQSDCGIIYYPKRNYVLCVMIKGPDTEQTDKHIAEVSKLAFDYINSLK